MMGGFVSSRLTQVDAVAAATMVLALNLLLLLQTMGVPIPGLSNG